MLRRMLDASSACEDKSLYQRNVYQYDNFSMDYTLHCSTSLNQNQMIIETVLVFSECFLGGFYLTSPYILKLTLYNLHQAEPHVNDQI